MQELLQQWFRKQFQLYDTIILAAGKKKSEKLLSELIEF